MSKVRAKNTKDIPGLVESRQKQINLNDKLGMLKIKSFSDLTQDDKDFLLKLLFERAGFIKS
jgi:hypothetical protein